MTFKQAITRCCRNYAKDYPEARFVGYNVAKGSLVYGTLDGIPAKQLVETPVAENLMAGLAIGMALAGYRPVLCFERHDFVLLALDALVNHLDKLYTISGGQVKLPVIVRAIVGGKQPLNPGLQHCQDYTRELASMFKNTPVVAPETKNELEVCFSSVGKTESGGVVLVEYRDRYGGEL